jgi:hypothetical protein
MAASASINWCNTNSWVAKACLHAGIWWNGSTSGVYWQWPECTTYGNPFVWCDSSAFSHWYLGNGETDLWQTSDVTSPLGYKILPAPDLCVHINYIVGRYGPISASTSQWYTWNAC